MSSQIVFKAQLFHKSHQLEYHQESKFSKNYPDFIANDMISVFNNIIKKNYPLGNLRDGEILILISSDCWGEVFFSSYEGASRYRGYSDNGNQRGWS